MFAHWPIDVPSGIALPWRCVAMVLMRAQPAAIESQFVGRALAPMSNGVYF